MVTVIDHGKYYDKEAEYYRFRCSCGCDFVCSKWDLRADTTNFSDDQDKMYIKCPDCAERNYISTSGFLMPIKDFQSKVVLNSKLVECLTKDEYNMLINKEDPKPADTEE